MKWSMTWITLAPRYVRFSTISAQTNTRDFRIPMFMTSTKQDFVQVEGKALLSVIMRKDYKMLNWMDKYSCQAALILKWIVKKFEAQLDPK